MDATATATATGIVVAGADLHEVNGNHLTVFRLRLPRAQETDTNIPQHLTCVIRGEAARTTTLSPGQYVQVAGHLTRNTTQTRKTTGRTFLRLEASKVEAA